MEENQVTIKILPQPKLHFMLNSGLYGAERHILESKKVWSLPGTYRKIILILVQAILATVVAKRNIYINSMRTKTEIRALIKPGQSSSVSS